MYDNHHIYTIVTITRRIVSNVLMNAIKTYKPSWHNSNCLDFTQIIRHIMFRMFICHFTKNRIAYYRTHHKRILRSCVFMYLLMNLYLVCMNVYVWWTWYFCSQMYLHKQSYMSLYCKFCLLSQTLENQTKGCCRGWGITNDL